MRTAIHMDLAPNVRAAFEDHNDPLQLRLLDDFHRIWCCEQTWTAWRQAISFGIVLRIVQGVVIVDSGGPELKRNPWLRSGSPPLTGRSGAFTACGRTWSANDNIAGPHVRNIGKLPNAEFAGNSAEIHRSVGQTRGRLARQRISSAWAVPLHSRQCD